MKQESANKPIKVEWDKRGERNIIMAPVHVWKKWETIFKKFEEGDLTDLDTGELVKKSENDVDLSNLSHITQSTLKDLNSISVDQLERAADHILAKVPRIYIGKKPKKWCRAMSLPGWCERRKWKNVLVKEINDRIGYYQPDQQNLFFDELGH